MAKNPFMSAYLSAANRVANTARGKATNEIKRQSKRQPPAWSTPRTECMDPQAQGEAGA